jgi:preprotein translocase subunit SecE
MAKDQAPTANLAPRGRNAGRGPKAQPPAKSAPAGEAAAPKKKRVSPVQFLREVRAEARKITWTSRKETWITSVMVFIMVVLTTLFFAVVDLGLGWGVSQIIKIGS